MPKFDWDRGLDYDATRKRLGDLMEAIRPECPPDIIPKKRLTHYSILLTQLANATRVSEAFDAVDGWVLDGEREQQVKTRKRGRVMKCQDCGSRFRVKSKVNSPDIHTKKTGHSTFEEVEVVEPRLVIIPPECLESDKPWLKEALERGLTIGSVKAFSIRSLGFNTHALRYSKITNLSKAGQPAQVIAKITHHVNMNFILDYTQQKEADETLRRSVG